MKKTKIYHHSFFKASGVIFMGFLLTGCIVSRTARPCMSGRVIDARTGQPISGCLIGDVTPSGGSREEGTSVTIPYRDENGVLHAEGLSAGTAVNGHIEGETYTNDEGFFELSEKRYREIALPGKEAPPIDIRVMICGERYECIVLKYFSRYGGGHGPGMEMKLDVIRLRRLNK